MTTLQQLKAQIRPVLGSETHWPDTRINDWIRDGLREYSLVFPHRQSASLACTAGVRSYSLPAGCLGVLRVAFPQGETEPRYLTRLPETAEYFEGRAVYDLQGEPPGVIVLGETPASGQSIGVEYACTHDSPGSESSVLTVPDVHLEALKLYVVWQAARQLEMEEAVDPNEKSLLLGTFGINAVRAERVYRARLDEYRRQAGLGRVAGAWRLDGRDRVY